MIVDNKNLNQVIGENNIVGKYYKGDAVNIRSTMTKTNIIKKNNENENNLEKMIIGDKKFVRKKRANCSSVEITKNILFNDNNENNLEDDLNSNDNKYKNLININFNNEGNKKDQTNANKFKKQKIQNVVNIYTIKLKKYCSTLKIIKKRENHLYNKIKNRKHSENVSPAISEHKSIKKNEKERHYTISSQKDQPKLRAQILLNQDYHSKLQSDIPHQINNKNTFHYKLNSQTKINQNLFKIKEKKISNRKKRAQTIYVLKGKISSPKKSPKKTSSPKKLNTMRKYNDQQFSNLIRKYTVKKNKATETNVKKFVSGGIDSKRKLFNANKVNFKYSNTNGNILNACNNGINKKIVNKNIKRSNTINKLYNFIGNGIKLKEKEK